MIITITENDEPKILACRTKYIELAAQVEQWDPGTWYSLSGFDWRGCEAVRQVFKNYHGPVANGIRARGLEAQTVMFRNNGNSKLYVRLRQPDEPIRVRVQEDLPF